MPKRAGLYLRISEDRKGEMSAVDRQRADGLKLIELRGWSLDQEFVDNDISAAGRRKRPGFDALLAAVEDGQVEVIVAWALDRLGRNRTDHLRLVDTCQARRVSLALVRGSDVDMTSAVGRGFADMMATFARMENEQKSERQRRQVQQAAEAGRMGGAPRAFGYLRGGLELDPVESPALRDMYEQWLSGAGLQEIADWVNRRGLTTPKGKPWRSQTVRVVLGNPRNGGLRAMRPVVDHKSGRRAVWHDDPIGPAVWPGVVSEEVWQAAMARLKDPARAGMHNQGKAPGPQVRNLLSGLAKCGRCGAHMITSQTGGNTRTYECSSKRHFSRRARYIETHVIETLLKRLSRPDAIDLVRPPTDDVDLDGVRQEALAKRRKLTEMADDYADGLIDREQLRSGTARLRSRLAELEAMVAAAGEADVVAPLVLAEDVTQAWELYPLSKQRAVLAGLMDITIMRIPPGRPKGGLYDTSSVRIRWR